MTLQSYAQQGAMRRANRRARVMAIANGVMWVAITIGLAALAVFS